MKILVGCVLSVSVLIDIAVGRVTRVSNSSGYITCKKYGIKVFQISTGENIEGNEVMATLKHLVDESKKYVTKDKKNMHWVALYFPDNKQAAHIMAYIAEKGSSTTKKAIVDSTQQFVDSTHTECQLVITAMHDMTNKVKADIEGQIENSEQLGKSQEQIFPSGDLYVYTFANLCTTPGSDSDGISCVRFYNKISERYPK